MLATGGPLTGTAVPFDITGGRSGAGSNTPTVRDPRSSRSQSTQHRMHRYQVVPSGASCMSKTQRSYRRSSGHCLQMRSTSVIWRGVGSSIRLR